VEESRGLKGGVMDQFSMCRLQTNFGDPNFDDEAVQVLPLLEEVGPGLIGEVVTFFKAASMVSRASR
jgi:hypothetical protein